MVTFFSSFCDLLQITKTRTTAYRPSSNGQVERYNRTLLQIIRCYLKKGQDHWDEFVQLAAAAIRSTVNRMTRYTPNRLMLGREVNVPLSLMLGCESPIGGDSYPKNLKIACK